MSVNIPTQKFSQLHSSHTVMVCTQKVFYTHHPLITLYTSLVPAASTALGSHIFAWPRNRKKASFFFKVEQQFPFFQSAIFFPLTSAPLTCHPQLQAGTKCTVYYTFAHRQCLCTHKPFLLSFLSLSLQIVLENAVKHEMALLMPSAQMCLA